MRLRARLLDRAIEHGTCGSHHRFHHGDLARTGTQGQQLRRTPLGAVAIHLLEPRTVPSFQRRAQQRGHQHPRFGLGDDLGQRRTGRTGLQRHNHRPETCAGQIDDGQFDAGHSENRDHRARLDSGRAPPRGGYRLDAIGHFGVGNGVEVVQPATLMVSGDRIAHDLERTPAERGTFGVAGEHTGHDLCDSDAGCPYRIEHRLIRCGRASLVIIVVEQSDALPAPSCRRLDRHVLVPPRPVEQSPER